MASLHSLIEHIREQQETMRRLIAPHESMMRYAREVLEPMRKQMQEQQDAVRKLTAPHEAMLRHAREAIQPMQDLHKAMATQMEAIHSSVRPLQQYVERIRQQQEAWATSIRGIMEEVPKRMRKVQEYLFERGWYLGPEAALPGISDLAKMIARNEHEAIEQEMQEWAETRIDAVLKEIKSQFASRHAIIGDALAAHRDGKYTLSVPVLLAQADGLAKELIGSFLFRGNPKKDFARLLSSLEPVGMGFTLDALATPLRSYSTLGKKPKHPIPGSEQGHANRHDVLHGVSTDYPTKANSLRVVSLIDYLLGIKGMLNDHKELASKWRKELKEALDAADKSPVAARSDSADGKVR